MSNRYNKRTRRERRARIKHFAGSAAAGEGAVGVGVDVGELFGGALLAPPLEIVGYGDVGHLHVEAHVLLVADRCTRTRTPRMAATVGFLEEEVGVLHSHPCCNGPFPKAMEILRKEIDPVLTLMEHFTTEVLIHRSVAVGRIVSSGCKAPGTPVPGLPRNFSIADCLLWHKEAGRCLPVSRLTGVLKKSSVGYGARRARKQCRPPL